MIRDSTKAIDGFYEFSPVHQSRPAIVYSLIIATNKEKVDSLKVAKVDINKKFIHIFINIYFGNLETINLLLITVYPYVSTNECDAVARPIPLPIPSLY